MADTNTTTSINDNLMASYFSQDLISRLEPNTPLIEFAVKDDLPLRTGKTATFQGWRALDGASTSLSEGTANSLPALSSRRVVATIVGYGRGVKLTDLFQMTSFFDAVNGAMDVLTDSARKTVEKMCQMGIYKNSILKNSRTTLNLSSYISSVASAFCAINGTHSGDIQFQFPAVFAGSVTRLSAYIAATPNISNQLSVNAVRKAVTRLRSRDAQPMADGFYVGYAHPNALHSLRKDPTWITWNKAQYAKETFYKGESGTVENVRFINSTMAFRYAVAAHSVCGVFIFGQGAFGFTSLDGMVKMMIARGPDKADTWDQFTPVNKSCPAVEESAVAFSNNGQYPEVDKTVALAYMEYARTTDKSVETPRIYSLLSQNNKMNWELTQMNLQSLRRGGCVKSVSRLHIVGSRENVNQVLGVHSSPEALFSCLAA